jgi:hypothetical protein
LVILGRSLLCSILRVTGMIVIVRVRVLMLVALLVTVMIMVRGLSVSLALMCMFVLDRRSGLAFGVVDDLALHALAAVAASRIAMARAPAARAVLVLFLGFAVGALVGLDQRLTVGDRDLIVVGMDFAEGEEAVAIAAIFDKGGLQRRLDARDLGEIDIAAKLLALGGLEIKLFDAIATDHDNPGLFRVGGIDQHFVRHF